MLGRDRKLRKNYTKGFKKYNAGIFRYIYLRVNCKKEAAQDLTQDVFEKAWKNRKAFDHTRSSFKNWLFVIARTTVIDYYRKSQVKESSLDEFDGSLAVKTDTDDRIIYEQIIKGLSKLSKNEKELIILRFVEEFTIAEIAEMLGKKYTATKISIYRALKKLRVMLIK